MNTLNILKNKAILGAKLPALSSVFIGVLLGVALFGLLAPRATKADINLDTVSAVTKINIVKNGRLTVCKLDKSAYEVVKKIKMIITAYSSTPDQTDDTPFITASGKQVADGIIANNLLPIGTKVRIPSLYGNKIFTVEDRMHKRMGVYRADIWLPERVLAVNFGVKTAYIEVLEN